MVSIHVGSRGDISGYISDRALVSGTETDEEKQNKRETSDRELFMHGSTSMGGALTIYESALEAQENEVPNSNRWRYLERLKAKQLERINELRSEEQHPKALVEGATYVHEKYLKMTPAKRRQEYASSNPDVLRDGDVTAQMLSEELKVGK